MIKLLLCVAKLCVCHVGRGNNVCCLSKFDGGPTHPRTRIHPTCKRSSHLCKQQFIVQILWPAIESVCVCFVCCSFVRLFQEHVCVCVNLVPSVLNLFAVTITNTLTQLSLLCSAPSVVTK